MTEMDYKENQLESYIVRIYRREGKSEGQMLGTVDDMQRDSQMKFRSFEELKSFLQNRVGKRERLLDLRTKRKS